LGVPLTETTISPVKAVSYLKLSSDIEQEKCKKKLLIAEVRILDDAPAIQSATP
jgi:hypothetical protein